MSEKHRKLAFWLSTPNAMMVEIARDMGFARLVLDLEHGGFDQSQLNMFIPFCQALGFELYAKVLGPETEPIQQALDFGADGVIIPHVEGLDHAREVTASAKYPPLGKRSYAAGRIVRYRGLTDGFFSRENSKIKCFPMIETSAALKDVGNILGLPTVDGVFVGPSDLALSRGRETYAFTEDDRHDIEAIAEAARAYGKPWIMPAWTAEERAFSRSFGAEWMVVLAEQGIAVNGMQQGLNEIQREEELATV